MAIFMVRALGLTPVDPTTGIFNDTAGLPPEMLGSIERVFLEGISPGCATAPLRYCPNDPMIRDVMARFLVNSFNLPQVPP